MTVHLWLRAETKPLEERTALPPQHAEQLLAVGFKITVEHCPQRIFSIDDYAEIGCEIVAAHSWQDSAPEDAIILGLKEFSAQVTFPLTHRHIQFAHAYKEQQGWQEVLGRFTRGNGTLYDIEFLVNPDGRRVAAFGYWAGYSGCAVSVLSWIAKQNGTELGPLSSYPDREALLAQIRTQLEQLSVKPKIIIIGARGRCGTGALDLATALGIEVSPWDAAETAEGGPFTEILEHDIFVNCVFIQQMIPPFITREMLAEKTGKLQVICDVSCDPFGEYNPLPIYSQCTSFNQPTVLLENSADVSLVAIDHLPSLLPKESSEDFCSQLMPTLKTLNDIDNGVWGRAKDTFLEKSAQIK
ncbi:saccharopine dehydrogenase ['Osedax' symbiont bacterium Rs2_46_30_T18]|nr:saccharopine dehydrogenase ['Osedax' symbiont bacterium Rs2_46_30_T18]